jgi:hypothetical protein
VDDRVAVVIYPNSGEMWNTGTRTWEGKEVAFTDLSDWVEENTRLVGGYYQRDLKASLRGRSPGLRNAVPASKSVPWCRCMTSSSVTTGMTSS